MLNKFKVFSVYLSTHLNKINFSICYSCGSFSNDLLKTKFYHLQGLALFKFVADKFWTREKINGKCKYRVKMVQDKNIDFSAFIRMIKYYNFGFFYINNLSLHILEQTFICKGGKVIWIKLLIILFCFVFSR